MKTFLLSSLLLILLNQPDSSSETLSADQYTFIKKELNINLYYRWVLMPDKLQVRELKAEFYVQTTPDRVLNLLRDETLALKWMKGVNKFHMMGKPSEFQWYSYIQYDIPWPLSNQDCIVKYELLQNSSEKVLNVQMKGIPDYIPVKDGITRIDHLLGSWVITTSSSNTCKVSYTIMSGQPPKFPRWITDPIIQSNLVNTMDAFRNIAEQKIK